MGAYEYSEQEEIETALQCEQQMIDGSFWLDRQAPGWLMRIDLDTLQMLSISKCLLGQLFTLELPDGETRYGYHRVHEDYKDMEVDGDIPTLFEDEMLAFGFAGNVSTDLWKRFIDEKRQGLR